jgi:UDP-glucuronate 4-epimerase
LEKILVTGSAGFIGFHLINQLLNDRFEIFGLDIINDYYDVNLKYNRLKEHGIEKDNLVINTKIKSNKFSNYTFIKADLSDFDYIVEFMKVEKFDYVVNLGAQAGVRYSLDNPRAYLKSNIDGFLSILEGARHSNVKHLLFASTSSVYGLNSKMPLSENMITDHPISLYAATKKSNEVFAHSYSHLFNIPVTGMRFFTVYGPWGRPDMALFLFTKSIIKGMPINVFNYGNMVRDFTYVSDIANSIKKLIFLPPIINSEWNSENPDPSFSTSPFRVLNIGNSNPVKLSVYINELEKVISKKAIWNSLEIQPGDVCETHADTQKLEKLINFKPSTSISSGIKSFFEWYKMYYKLN